MTSIATGQISALLGSIMEIVGVPVES
jgi:hypothetical protein